ncbi:hypothetical protein GCM10009714_02690 [Microlunatus capsulatus]
MGMVGTDFASIGFTGGMTGSCMPLIMADRADSRQPTGGEGREGGPEPPGARSSGSSSFSAAGRDSARAPEGTSAVVRSAAGQPRRELRLKPAALCEPEERPGLDVV